MTHDLVERLRDPNYAGSMQHLRSYDEIDRLFNQAADKIETYMADADAHVSRLELVRRQEDEIRDLKAENAALRAEKAELRKALERIAAMWGTAGSEKGLPCRITDLNGTRESHTSTGVFASDVARQALAAIRNMGERT